MRNLYFIHVLSEYLCMATLPLTRCGQAIDQRHGILRHVYHPQKIADKVGSADMLRQTNALISTSFFNLCPLRIIFLWLPCRWPGMARRRGGRWAAWHTLAAHGVAPLPQQLPSAELPLDLGVNRKRQFQTTRKCSRKYLRIFPLSF